MSEEYRAMWEGLGINIRRHDMLLTALPEIFQQVYLSQQDRPQAMDFFDFVVSQIHGIRVKELMDHKAKGGKVFGTFCVYVPEEIIVAGGGIAVGLCGGADFSVPTGEQILPRNLCALIKSATGFKLGKICPYFESADVIVGETTCDGKKKTWESLDEYAPERQARGAAAALRSAQGAPRADQRARRLTGSADQLLRRPDALYADDQQAVR